MSVFDKHIGHPIDTSEWKEFKVGDLFTIEKGHIQTTNLQEGTTRLVSCSAQNNGVVGYCDIPAKWKNKITVSANGQPGIAFYQEDNFNATGDVNVLIENNNIELTKYAALFICAIITKMLSPKYSYTNKLGKAKLEKEIIKLPVTDSGEPDWEFMEQTMRNLWDKVKTNFSTENHAHQIDTSKWKEFKVGDLFDVINGTYNPLNNEDPTGINMISVTNFNNGIVGKYKPAENSKIFSAGKITWGKQAPAFFYQSEPFITNQSIYMLDVSAISKMAALFICAILQKTIAPKYNYSYNLIGSRMKEETIKLPITDSGEPDWEFMENMMKEVERRSLLIQHFKKKQP